MFYKYFKNFHIYHIRSGMLRQEENVCTAQQSSILKPEGWQMKRQDEKRPIIWEVKDPKPPVIQSGKMEQQFQKNRENDV